MRPTLLVVLCCTVIAGGCTDDTVTTPTPDAPPAPAMTAEPAFTGGTDNTVAWTRDDDGSDLTFEVQASVDPGFAEPAASASGLTALEHRFDGLEDGATYHYRVRAVHATGPDGPASPWSASVHSAQDASPPAAALSYDDEVQTSTRVRVTLDAADAGSGLVDLELWAARGGDDLAFHSAVTPGGAVYLSDAGGELRLDLLARDGVGNLRAPDVATAAVAVLPAPVIITDQLGETWDITNAARRYGMTIPGWAQGIGRNTIRPITDPAHLATGDVGFPGADEIFIALTLIDGGTASLAMPLSPMYSREVLNDTFLGEPVSMTF